MYKYLILIILFYACEITTSPTIPPIYDDETVIYNVNLKSINSGENIDYVTINWAIYTNESEDFIAYTIRDENQTILEIDTITTNSYDIQLAPETFYNLYLDVHTNTYTYTDSIQIFTRSVHPINNLNIVADANSWFTSLNWSASEEIESNFNYYNIYRALENHDIFNDLNNCNCLIDTIQNQSIVSYVDSINLDWGSGYYYIIETVTNQENTRESHIKSNILNPSYHPEINNENTYASNSEYNKVIINWNHNLDQNEFYALEIWRSNSEKINHFDSIQLVAITDYNKNNFEDYFEIGDGMMWYYKLKLIDIYGNVKESSTFTGSSHP